MLVKLPVPVPLLVVLSETVGFRLVLQQIPRLLIADPPLEFMMPPELALEAVIFDRGNVEITGRVPATFVVLKSNCRP